VTVLWFSLGIPVSSTNKTDCHDIAEILLKVVLNTINQTICLDRIYGMMCGDRSKLNLLGYSGDRSKLNLLGNSGDRSKLNLLGNSGDRSKEVYSIQHYVIKFVTDL
jgi:hypothetical protein